jgi:hypothetical protein
VVSRRPIASALVLAALAAAAAIFRPDRAIRVATGAFADAVCAKTFVSGLDPQTVFAETMDRPGIRRLRLMTASIRPAISTGSDGWSRK